MRDIATKSDNTGDKLTAGDFNAINLELENAVTSADLILDPAGGPDTNTDMLSEAISAYANAGSTYTDSGSADSYVLSISTNLKQPTKYFDNMTVRFKPGNTNTGAATVNVAGLGIKTIKDSAGADLAAGALLIDNYYTLVYNLAGGYFESDEIVTPSGSGGVINTDSTIIGADSDSNGVGEIIYQIKGVNKGGVDALGIVWSYKQRIETSLDMTGAEMVSDLDFGGFELLNSRTILDMHDKPYYWFDGLSGRVKHLDNSKYSGIFQNGTTYLCGFNAFSAGEANVGLFFTKTHFLRFLNSTGTVQFVALHSTTNGLWQSATPIEFNVGSVLVLRYDGSDVSNNPQLDVNGVSIAMTETQTPVGTLNTDTGTDLYFSNASTDSATFHGAKYFDIFLNHEITDAEAQSISSNPKKALAYADEFGSNVPVYENVLDTSVGVFAAALGALTAAVTVGGLPSLEFAIDSSSGIHGAQDVIAVYMKNGKRDRISFDVYIPSANVLLDGVFIGVSGTAKDEIYTSVPRDIWTRYYHEMSDEYSDAAGVDLIIGALHGTASSVTGNGADKFYLRNFEVVQLGATLISDGKTAGPVQTIDRANGLIGTVTGAVLANRTPEKIYNDRYDSIADNGTITTPTEAASLEIELNVVTAQASTTLRIGTTDGGQDVVADTVLTATAGFHKLTVLISKFIAGDTLYIGSDGGVAWTTLDADLYVSYKTIKNLR